MLGLADSVAGCLFDLDGVLTQTAKIHAVGNRKNELVLELIRKHGVQPYEGSVRYLRAALGAGLRCAVVSSSTNAHDVLIAAGIAEMFEVVIDGVVAEREHLVGKPAPDTFLAGARALGLETAQAGVFEDALAGVQAGRADASASSSASTGPVKPTRSVRTGRTWSSVTWPSCSDREVRAWRGGDPKCRSTDRDRVL